MWSWGYGGNIAASAPGLDTPRGDNELSAVCAVCASVLLFKMPGIILIHKTWPNTTDQRMPQLLREEVSSYPYLTFVCDSNDYFTKMWLLLLCLRFSFFLYPAWQSKDVLFCHWHILHGGISFQPTSFQHHLAFVETTNKVCAYSRVFTPALCCIVRILTICNMGETQIVSNILHWEDGCSQIMLTVQSNPSFHRVFWKLGI